MPSQWRIYRGAEGAVRPGRHVLGGGNFGLDDTGADADYEESSLGKNGIYTVYWNVAENEPISIDPDNAEGDQRTKIINVIVEWHIKDKPRRISMDVIRMKEG